MLLVVYFDQLLGAACTQKLIELLFSVVFNLFCSFQTFFSVNFLAFFVHFNREITKKVLNQHKRLKTAEKKEFDQLSGAASTWKLVEIHNSCSFVACKWDIFLQILPNQWRGSYNWVEKSFYLKLSRTPWSCGLIGHVLDWEVEGLNLSTAGSHQFFQCRVPSIFCEEMESKGKRKWKVEALFKAFIVNDF